MKAYVLRYSPIKPGDPDFVSKPNWTDYNIAFDTSPLWTLASRAEAEAECRSLERFGVYMPDGHRCEFAMDGLDPQRFAVYCVSHPTPQATGAGSKLAE